MLVIDWPAFLENGLPLNNKKTSVTVGVFDGVHRGHRALIERVVSYNADYAPVVVTFRENHKKDSDKSSRQAACAAILRAEARGAQRKEDVFDLIDFEQKTEILAGLGVQVLLVIDFTESFRNTGGIEFLRLLTGRGNVGFFAVGSGFRCGRDLDTDAAAIGEFLSSRGIPFETVPHVLEDGLPISSSRIRAALAAGDTELALKMLGRT
jgi:riboflavin kinase/FMN adenylyltransferase